MENLWSDYSSYYSDIFVCCWICFLEFLIVVPVFIFELKLSLFFLLCMLSQPTNGSVEWLIFNSMSTCLGLSYA